MGVYVDKFVGYIVDVSKEENIEEIACNDQETIQFLKDLNFKGYYDASTPGENDITLVYDGMCGQYAKLIFIKSVEYFSDDESEPNSLINEALKTVQVPLEIREQMQKVYSHIFNSDKPIEVYLQEFSHWH